MATFSRLFSNLDTTKNNSNSHLPMLNSLAVGYSNYIQSVGQTSKKKSLMSWFKSIPELTGLANKVAKDIVRDYHFENANPYDSGVRRIMNANKFSAEVKLRKTMFSQAIDSLITGESFGWMGKLKSADVMKEILNSKALRGLESKDRDALAIRFYNEFKALNGFADTTGVDEDLLRPRKYRYIASSTMETVHDDFDIIGYKQIVAGKTINFNIDEIIRFTLFDIDGKVGGFTPVESILVQLELLRLMWQNMVSIHHNGGSPDKIVIAKDVQPGSPAYERIKEQLQKYKLVENKHGNMLFTGNIDVMDMQQLDKMQFMDSGLYITGLVALQWGIPRSSIPYIVGGSNTKDDTGGNSEKGYWDNIEYFQKCIADDLNTQLFIPYFGVRIVFDRRYMQYDIQENQALQLKFNNVQLMNNILQSTQKRLTGDKVLHLLDITNDDVEDLPKPEFDEMGNQIPNGAPMMTLNNQMSKDEGKDSDDKKNIKKKKSDEQVGSQTSRGTPTGYGKESVKQVETKVIIKELDTKEMNTSWAYDDLLEFKSMQDSGVQEVNLLNFVKVYMEDMSYQQGKPPRIFVKQILNNVQLEFKSNDFVYRCLIANDEIDSISFMNLPRKYMYLI